MNTPIDASAIVARLDEIDAGTNREPPTSLERALMGLANGGSIAPGLNALKAGKFVYRPDLYDCMCEAARAEGQSLEDAARGVLGRRANAGRRVESRAIGSTLLLKGLEAEHAVVLDADGMDARHLYVAISRASRSLTVVSRSPELPAR